MRALLERVNLDPTRIWDDGGGELVCLETVNGCVFLAREYTGLNEATLEQFPDRTGLECFVNHVHFQVGRGGQSLESVFRYVSAVRSSLVSLGDGIFEIIVSIADEKCVVRFHKWRSGESWLSEDLEGYKSEAMLSATVP